MQRKIEQVRHMRFEREAAQVKRQEENSLPGQAKRMVSSSASLAKKLTVGVATVVLNAAAAAADHVPGHNISSSATATGSDFSSSAGATAQAIAAEAKSGMSTGTGVILGVSFLIGAGFGFWKSGAGPQCLRKLKEKLRGGPLYESIDDDDRDLVDNIENASDGTTLTTIHGERPRKAP